MGSRIRKKEGNKEERQRGEKGRKSINEKVQRENWRDNEKR